MFAQMNRNDVDGRRTEITDRALNLSSLYELLHNTLLITEEVKEILRKDCDEAAFVLKPWRMKTVVEKRTHESTCNCKKNEDEAEEIAAGIGRAIVLAQELREKLKLNVAARSKVTGRSTVENIYSPKSASVSDRRKAPRNNLTTQNANAAKTSTRKTSSALQNDEVTSVKMRKPVGGTKQSTESGKTQLKVSSAKAAGKSQKEKNFILKNKLSIKKISSANKSQVDDSNSNDTPQNSRKSLPPEASATELTDLIHKITQQSTEFASISLSDDIKKDCPLHGDNARRSVEEQIVTVDVVEALNYFNVPNDIVKVLRSYHAFLKTEEYNLNDVKENRYKKSVDSFLKELETMNTTMQDYLLEESHLFSKATKSIVAFNSFFNEDLDLNRSINTEIASTEPGVSVKQSETKNITEPITGNVFNSNFSLARGWMLNGIWNVSCLEHFKSFSKAYSIRYCNKKQFLLLYEAIQKLQRTKYLNTLIQIILRDVIPTIKSNFGPTSSEFAQAYKTLFILQQGLNPKVPVLVKTDDI